MAFQFSNPLPPCVLFEDEHLLVVNKPAGWNTHAPSPFAGEGIYDWLKHREPRWASLAILHRLDKETSGVMVFGKSPLANRSLTEQFSGREVRKKYLLLTDREPKQSAFTAKSNILRDGERYASGMHGEPAETRFVLISPPASERRAPARRETGDGSQRAGSEISAPTLVEAEPLTGRTHQIRVHAAEHGFPILGDRLYGGTAFRRVCLHAAELCFRHPGSGEALRFLAPVDFEADARLALRAALIEPEVTTAFCLIQGASDGWPGWRVERLGCHLLSESAHDFTEAQRHELARLSGVKGVYHKFLNRQVRKTETAQASPKLVAGQAAPERFTIRENSVKFELGFTAGYSVGLFLDQRDNRRRFLTGHIAAGFPLFDARHRTQDAKPEVLNTFAYTGGFSVCAALGGARATSLDLSKKYLEWGKRNFALNDLEHAQHDFIFGDTFDWLERLTKKQRRFDVVVLDPPTFSQSKERGVFRAAKDYGRLVTAALPVLKAGGVLFASTNAADWPPEDFLAKVETAVRDGRRKILQRHYVPQPPDFPVSREESAFLKTIWLRIG